MDIKLRPKEILIFDHLSLSKLNHIGLGYNIAVLQRHDRESGKEHIGYRVVELDEFATSPLYRNEIYTFFYHYNTDINSLTIEIVKNREEFAKRGKEDFVDDVIYFQSEDGWILN